ncbi:MAG: hypothetical protein QW728_02450, partial [Thermoplasmata archaeon]
KTGKPSFLLSSDFNPDALDFMQKNLSRAYEAGRRFAERSGTDFNCRYVCLCQDAAELLRKAIEGEYSYVEYPGPDRVIMNLPHSAFQFLPAVFELLSSRHIKKATIHVYDIAPSEKLEEQKTSIIRTAAEKGYDNVKIDSRRIRGYAPGVYNWCHDVVIVR